MWELGLGLAIKDAERVIVIGAESDTSSFDIDSHRLTYRYNHNSAESLDDLYKTLREVMKRINRASIRKAPIQSPEVKSLLDNALKAVERKEWIAAEALFQTMDAREPENWYIYNQWGIMHRSKGEFDAAEFKFKQALRYTDMDDEKAFTYTELAVLHQIKREYREADEWFRKAEKADRGNNRLYAAWAEYFGELGDYFGAQAKIGAALAQIKSRDDDPTYKELMLRHAYYSKKISDGTYKRTFDQFRREEGLPRPALSVDREASDNRLPYDIDWNDLAENYVGTVVEGEISSITAEHGIFVRLSRQFTGLIFWKNLTEGFAEKFSKNEKVKVRISKAFINARDQRGRIDLRLVE
jgi:tetratricopeptide (TPR) repeat protein